MQIVPLIGVVAGIIAVFIALVGVGVALYLGVNSLRQIQDIQLSERKQRLITEIEEWAKEVIRFIAEYETGRGTADLWYHTKWR